MNQRNLSKEELDYYIEENKRYYKFNYNCKHNFHVGDIVIIGSELSHDNGYECETGIVQSYSGVDNYLYVVAYNNRAERYWACGFDEKDLTKSEKKWDELSKELISALYYWINDNGSSFLPKLNIDNSHNIKRLTNIMNGKAYLKVSCPDGEYFQQLIDKLAYYEDLEEQGLIKS